MKKFNFIGLSAFFISSILVACQTNETAEEPNNTQDQPENQEETNEAGDILVEGMADYYHTGDTIKLTAKLEEESELDQWHWYTLSPGQDPADEEAWEVVPKNGTNTFTGTAEEEGEQIQVRLFDNDHNVVSKSEPLTVSIDDHHGSSEDEDVAKRIYEGFFYYDEVGDRELSDFAGDWQSLYPYVTNGELDEVMEDRAENNDEMTKEDYIEYYETAYETDVNRVVITDDTFTFYYEDGREVTAEYASDGYEILERDTGNRQVRFVYKRQDSTEEMPTYMIFSDHNINAATAHHFHLYSGEDREALLAERTHFPTYYPSSLDANGIVRDMLAH